MRLIELKFSTVYASTRKWGSTDSVWSVEEGTVDVLFK